MNPTPDFIIIGAMKCATTTLHTQLAAQPGIALTDKLVEPDYFSDDDHYARGPQWYASLLPHDPDCLIGDASTGYTKRPTHPHAAERIAKDVPDAKLIYVMRHPVDRLVSHYVHDWSVHRVKDPIDKAVESHREIVDYGLYAMQLRPYLDHFGPKQILPVFFDRLVSRSQEELERVCSFIGYRGEAKWVDETARVNASSERLRKSRLRDTLVNAPVLSTIRKRLVPQGIRDRFKRLWMMDGRPQLSDAVRARVVREFDADLAELGRWFGLELSCESFKRVALESSPNWASDLVSHSGPVENR